MTDRELLELAAKACGFELLDCTCKKERKNSVTGKHWNPLIDDGDAFCLAVKLMEFEPYKSKGVLPFFSADVSDTRRAITVAAAEIGATL